MASSKTSPSARSGLPAGSAVETMAGIGSLVRPRGRRSSANRRTALEMPSATGEPATTSSYASGVDRLEGHARPVARGGRQRRVADDEAGRHRTGSGDRARIECRIERGAGRGLDPVIGSDVGPGDLDLTAFDADLEDRREGPDRHGQGQDQERQVAGRRVPAEGPEAEDRDEVAPAGAHPAEAADRQREEADREQADGETDEHRGRGEERVEPAARPGRGLARQPALAQEPGGGQRDDDRRPPRTRAGAAGRGRPADRRARDRGALGGPTGTVAATRRAVAPSATRIAPIDDRALGRALTMSPARARPIRAAGTVISSPSHSCAASNCPLEAPRPRARASAGRLRRTTRMPMSPTAPAATASGPSAATDRAASVVVRCSR